MADIKVISSQAIKEAYLAFQAEFERVSGHKLDTTWKGTVDALKALRAGDVFDMAILVTPAMEAMLAEGKIVRGSNMPLVRSGVGIAVPLGAPKPDLGSVETVQRALVAAPKGVGYSSGPSGVYLQELFKRWGLADQIKQTQTPPGTPVGTLLAKGAVDIGFQQVSELLLYPGIQYVGPVPDEMQEISIFNGGVHAAAKEPEAARELIKFIVSPAALPYIKKTGMEQGTA